MKKQVQKAIKNKVKGMNLDIDSKQGVLFRVNIDKKLIKDTIKTHEDILKDLDKRKVSTSKLWHKNAILSYKYSLYVISRKEKGLKELTFEEYKKKIKNLFK